MVSNQTNGRDLADISIAIPTYRREEVLLQTINALRDQATRFKEILVMDQTPEHGAEVAAQLRDWHAARVIRWIHLSQPSVPGAMNRALQMAQHPIVLFLDDDVVPAEGLLEAHGWNYAEGDVWAVAGQVLEPGQLPCPAGPRRPSGPLRSDLDFPFHSTERCQVRNCMAGNLSVRRDQALAIGGFDESYVRVAYRFETEFCRRLLKHGGRVVFEPRASLRHLKAQEGGIRSFGHHLMTWRPFHAVGDYYFALGYGLGIESLGYLASRLRKTLINRHSLTRPWRIPIGMLIEAAACLWAIWLRLRGPRYVQQHDEPGDRQVSWELGG
jgi:GT2 family glycosyltransferase